jgi:hypothetical protein
MEAQQPEGLEEVEGKRPCVPAVRILHQLERSWAKREHDWGWLHVLNATGQGRLRFKLSTQTTKSRQVRGSNLRERRPESPFEGSEPTTATIERIGFQSRKYAENKGLVAWEQ